MTIAWTEVMSSFTPAGTGWQDYNLFSNKGVPKGAIAYIVMAHTDTGAVRTLGLRTDGSALARTCILNKAGTGGACAVGMYVKCHASTGLIETYCDATAGVTFYLVGYWTGTDFTELATDITGTTVEWDWVSRDLYTNQSIPKGSVCSVLCLNQAAGYVHMGVRTGGSSLYRVLMLPTCSGGSSSAEATTYQVKSNASTGVIELFRGNSGTVKFLLAGYFDASMDYVELEDIESWSSSWYDFDLTPYTDQDGRVVDIGMTHYSTSAAHTLGARKNGTSLARYIAIKPSPDGYEGFLMPTATDTSGILELYHSPIGSGYFYAAGYYKDGTSGQTLSFTITETINLAEATGIAKSITVAEGIGAEDLCPLSKNIDVAEQLTVGEVLRVVKAIIAAEDVDASDTVWMVKTMLETEAVRASDAAIMTKAIKLAELMRTSDVLVLSKAIKAADTITLADVAAIIKAFIALETIKAMDAVSLVKALRMTDGAGLGESIALTKSMKLVEGARASDGAIASKVLKIFEGLSASDAAFLTKAIKVLENAKATDGTSVSKSMLIGDGARLGDAVVLVKLLTALELVKASDAAAVSRILAFVVADGLTLGDAVSLIKTLRASEGAAVGDAAKLIKTIIVAQAIGAADKTVLQKALRGSEDLELGDGVIVGKTIRAVEQVATSDAVTLQKAIIAQEPVLVADTVSMIKQLLASDGIRISETVLRSILGSLTELYASETIGIADATTLNKAIRVAQAIAASDVYKLVKAALLVERLGLDDDTKVTKALLRGDAIAVQDLARISKLIATSEGVTFDDEVQSDRSIVLEETVTAGDLVALAKEILSREDIVIEDGTRLTTVIMRALRITRLNAALKRGRSSGTKASLEVEGGVGESKTTGRKDGANIEGIKHEEELDG